jgi:hypothetical protein
MCPEINTKYRNLNAIFTVNKTCWKQ